MDRETLSVAHYRNQNDPQPGIGDYVVVDPQAPDEAIIAMSGPDNPLMACIARLIATGIAANEQAWGQAEHERGTDPAIMITALQTVMAALIATTIEIYITDEGIAHFAQKVGEMTEQDILKLVITKRAARAAGKL